MRAIPRGKVTGKGWLSTGWPIRINTLKLAQIKGSLHGGNHHQSQEQLCKQNHTPRFVVRDHTVVLAGLRNLANFFDGFF
jgi:hypothetical protein